MPRHSLLISALLTLSTILCAAKVLPTSLQDQLSLAAATVSQGGALWTLLTHALIIREPAQLVVLLLPIFLFAVPLEGLLGGAKLWLLYWLGVLSGGLVFAVSFAETQAVLSGSLASTLSFAGAAVVLSLLSRLPPRASSLPLWGLALIFVLGSAWIAAAQRPDDPLLGASLRLAAVIPGALCGLIWARTLPKNHASSEDGV